MDVEAFINFRFCIEQYPGAGNMFRGLFFTDCMSRSVPDFFNEAPTTGSAAGRRYLMLTHGSGTTSSLESEEFKKFTEESEHD